MVLYTLYPHQVRHKDGKVEQTFRDGRRVVLFSNGTRKETRADGSSVVETPVSLSLARQRRRRYPMRANPPWIPARTRSRPAPGPGPHPVPARTRGRTAA
jgi:hypothetical protein